MGLFPNTTSLVIFVSYISLYVGQGIFITASFSKGQKYSYNTVTVVLLTEVTKMIMAYLCYIKDHSFSSLCEVIKNNGKILTLYLIPSFLYCIYNNLAFVNLSHFDPTSYFILLQLRVVFTGILYQVVFKKKLSKMQWVSLIILTSGCMAQEMDWNFLKSFFINTEKTSTENNFFSIYLLFIVIQTLCSCFAGVYNEHLLKESGANVNIFIQNIFMYVDSIFWNFLVLWFQGSLISTFTAESVRTLFQPLVIVIIINNSIVGIITSLFLNSLNSILKTFASAIELSITPILTWIIFRIEIKLSTIFALAMIFYSLYLYKKYTVTNKTKPQDDDARTNVDKLPLLQEV